MTIPDFQTLMLPVLHVAAAKNEEVRISDAVAKLTEDFALTSDELSLLLPSGKQRALVSVE